MEEQIQQLENRIKELESKLQILIFSDRYVFQKNLQFQDGRNIQLATGTGSKFGTATTQKLGFFNTTPAVQQTSAANLTNNVTAGGTDNQIDDFTDLTTYSNSAATIRNNMYQLARKLKQINDGLRTLGLFS